MPFADLSLGCRANIYHAGRWKPAQERTAQGGDRAKKGMSMSYGLVVASDSYTKQVSWGGKFEFAIYTKGMKTKFFNRGFITAPEETD